jgi:hypothetical protein
LIGSPPSSTTSPCSYSTPARKSPSSIAFNQPSIAPWLSRGVADASMYHAFPSASAAMVFTHGIPPTS